MRPSGWHNSFLSFVVTIMVSGSWTQAFKFWGFWFYSVVFLDDNSVLFKIFLLFLGVYTSCLSLPYAWCYFGLDFHAFSSELLFPRPSAPFRVLILFLQSCLCVNLFSPCQVCIRKSFTVMVLQSSWVLF